MGFTARLLAAIGIETRSSAYEPHVTTLASSGLAGVRTASDPGNLSIGSAVSLSAVYRSISIIATSMRQLSLVVERQGEQIPASDVPSFIRRPNLQQSRGDFIETATISLAATGNAYIKLDRFGDSVDALHVLDPWLCHAVIDEETGTKTIAYKGKSYSVDEIIHVPLLTLPGSVTGLGPIQASHTELTTAKDIRDFASGWFRNSGQPQGILSTDQKVNPEDLVAMRNAWNYLDAEGNPLDMTKNPSRIRVLPHGLSYTPILISPRDAQWIEAQQFNTTQIARIFGIPAPLLLAAVEGNAQTYSNVEQEWIAFTRFTLQSYITRLEDALTAITPRGQRVKFNVEALLRSDTTTRYAAHKTAIEMGLYSAQYAREIEGIPASAAPTHESEGTE
nr:MAG TPA: portal protein [Caudoviricetes sp.]